MNNEIAALKSAIEKYGDSFAKLVVGISVGSEDLYRDSTMGIEAKAGIGAGPDTVVSYIKQVRSAIAGTPLSQAPIGHVDTWTAWTNGSVASVIEACDWIGVDAYPYFQSTMSNSVEDAKSLFDSAMSQTQAVAGNKEVWITETGWPVSGSTQNLGVASVANAKAYWDEVGCSLFGKINTWWYILQDSAPVTPNPSFGIVGSKLSNTPLFDLTCPTVSKSSSSSSSSSSPSSSGTKSASSSSTSSSLSSAASSSESSTASSSESSSVSSSDPSPGAASSDPSGASASGFVTSAGGATATGGAGSAPGSFSPTTSSSSSGSKPTTNSASVRSGSLIGAMGAIFAAVALL
jgi:glucan endo-1,3-beta-D-glucosidase